jgi:hypothetical protein
MNNSSNIENMRNNAGKRKRRDCRKDTEEMQHEPARKLRRRLPNTDVNSSTKRVATHRPLSGSAAGQQRAQITDGKSYKLEPEVHADEEHCSVGGSEQVAEHSSVEKNSDGDSLKCPVCSFAFTTQEVATPDTCDHTFCSACLQELSQNENNCPVDKKMFNFILVRHHLGGKIITYIPVEPATRQGECNREDGEPLCCENTLGHGWNPGFALAYLLAFCYAVTLVPAWGYS